MRQANKDAFLLTTFVKSVYHRPPVSSNQSDYSLLTSVIYKAFGSNDMNCCFFFLTVLGRLHRLLCMKNMDQQFLRCY